MMKSHILFGGHRVLIVLKAELESRQIHSG